GGRGPASPGAGGDTIPGGAGDGVRGRGGPGWRERQGGRPPAGPRHHRRANRTAGAPGAPAIGGGTAAGGKGPANDRPGPGWANSVSLKGTGMIVPRREMVAVTAERTFLQAAAVVLSCLARGQIAPILSWTRS